MSKWMLFNLIIFGIIIFLITLMKISGYYSNPRPFPTPSSLTEAQLSTPTITPLQTLTASSSVSVKNESEQKLPLKLTPAEEPALSLAVLLPQDWRLEANKLVHKESKNCQFSKLSPQPAGDQIIEKRSLADLDLPQVEVITYYLNLKSGPTKKRYVFKNEENVAQLELICDGEQKETTEFLLVLNSVRFTN